MVDLDTALQCIEWYTCRWIIEEVFRILKKEGFNIEASELGCAKAIRKLSLMMMETIVKLFLMQIAYNMPEERIKARSCFSNQELLECLEHQMIKLEEKTEKLKNPYTEKDLKDTYGPWKGSGDGKDMPVGENQDNNFCCRNTKFAAIMQGWHYS